ncbi:MAG: hypothetical protein WKF59_11255 [Chitinophagaceae bacterium]
MADISEKRLLKEEVDAEDIAESVAKATGIPVNKMLQSEREKLLSLEDELHKRVVGQDEAIEAVCRCHTQKPGRFAGCQKTDWLFYISWYNRCW